MSTLNGYRDAETIAREEPVCRGCGKPKDVGCTVCWGCFKYRDNAFKYFDGGDLNDWLEAIGRGDNVVPM